VGFFLFGERITNRTFHDIVFGNDGATIRHGALHYAAGSESNDGAQQANQKTKTFHDHAVPLSVRGVDVNLCLKRREA